MRKTVTTTTFYFPHTRKAQVSLNSTGQDLDESFFNTRSDFYIEKTVKNAKKTLLHYSCNLENSISVLFCLSLFSNQTIKENYISINYFHLLQNFCFYDHFFSNKIIRKTQDKRIPFFSHKTPVENLFPSPAKEVSTKTYGLPQMYTLIDSQQTLDSDKNRLSLSP